VAYVQVYRLKDRPQGWDAKINDVVETALQENHPYDFYSRDQIDGPLTCTGVGSLILERTGIPAVSIKSAVDARIFPNFARLGLSMKEFLAPSDYARDSRFESVGFVDNDELSRALAHQLVSGEVVDFLRTLLIDTDRLPGEFAFDLFAVNEAQKRTPVGEALLKLEGFNDADFPSGPAQLIALMPLMDQAMGSAAGLLSGSSESATAQIRSWFVPR
jgi:hypothetical protein